MNSFNCTECGHLVTWQTGKDRKWKYLEDIYCSVPDDLLIPT